MSIIPYALIESLQRSACYLHATGDIRMVETHISWVFLTGEYVYKVKKPVNFGFLDFTTLEKRKFYCEEELRLNRRLAEELYLEVVAIGGTQEMPQLGATTDIFEYAIKMKQFPDGQLLDQQLAYGYLTTQHIEDLAIFIGRFHQEIDKAVQESLYGKPETVWFPVGQNFDQIAGLLAHEDKEDLARNAKIGEWATAEYARCRDLLEKRKAEGFIRECHGDIHLGNAVLIGDRVTLFDGIEFNDTFRWIDVISDIAFLIMDLQYKGEDTLAWHALNAYLKQTGDYEGLQVLRFYQSYRAMVRAKVAGFSLAQTQDAGERQKIQRRYRSYFSLAERYANPVRPRMLIAHGISGSGKTTQSSMLVDTLGAIHICADVERKRIHGLSPQDRSREGLDAGLYTPAANQKTYQRLFYLAELLLKSGYSVLLDATFLKKSSREEAQKIAQRCGALWHILNFHADIDTVRQRILARESLGQDVSDATVEVMERQFATAEPLDETELAHTIDVNTERPLNPQALMMALGIPFP